MDERQNLGLQSDENLLEVLIFAAMSQGECKVLEHLSSQLNKKFPTEIGFFLPDLIKETKAVESLIQKEILNYCKAEVLSRMKRGQISA
jgi:hypothetical protein